MYNQLLNNKKIKAGIFGTLSLGLLSSIRFVANRIIGIMVHPKGNVSLRHEQNASNLYEYLISSEKSGFKPEEVKKGNIALKGVSYCEKEYKEGNGYVFCFWGNADNFTNHTNEIKTIAKRTNKKVISFFNRGVCASEGRPSSASVIISDAVDIVKKYVKDNEIAEKSLMFGHSIGGFQSTSAAGELHNQGLNIKVFNWSSGYSISKTAIEIFFGTTFKNKKLSKAVGFIAMLLPTILATAVGFIGQYYLGINPDLSYKILTASSATMMSVGTIFPSFAKKVLEKLIFKPFLMFAGWEIDVSKTGKKLYKNGYLLHGHNYSKNKADRVIKHQAQFYQCVKGIDSGLKSKLSDNQKYLLVSNSHNSCVLDYHNMNIDRAKVKGSYKEDDKTYKTQLDRLVEFAKLKIS